MSPVRINTIFFDAAGTLFTVNGSVGAIYARIAREHGKEVTSGDLEVGWRRAFGAAPPMAFPDASSEEIQLLEKQWWRNLVWEVFAPLGPFPAFDAYFEALFAFFARAEAWQLYPDTLTALRRLKAHGMMLGVISNFDSRLFGLLNGLGLAQFFDPVVISTHAGAAKPERGIFAHALARAGTPAEEAMHVGDSYEADVIGARQAGILPVFLDRQGKRATADGCATVGSLLDLLALVNA
jgi:putative hydrolase of the HAD superfamily